MSGLTHNATTYTLYFNLRYTQYMDPEFHDIPNTYILYSNGCTNINFHEFQITYLHITDSGLLWTHICWMLCPVITRILYFFLVTCYYKMSLFACLSDSQLSPCTYLSQLHAYKILYTLMSTSTFIVFVFTIKKMGSFFD